MVERFFYTVQEIHRPTSGPTLITIDLEVGGYIEDLDRARELALAARRGKWGDGNYVATAYGSYLETEPLDD